MISLASNANKHVYRIAMSGLLSLTNTLKQLRNGQNVKAENISPLQSFGISAPTRKEIDSDGVNQSKCVRKKRKYSSSRICSVCQQAGRADQEIFLRESPGWAAQVTSLARPLKCHQP